MTSSSSSAAAEATGTPLREPSLSEGGSLLESLPDVTLVSILSLLPMRDRFRAQQTCRTLRDAFLHPSLWYRMKIVLFCKADHNKNAAHSRQSYAKVGVTPQAYVNIIANFGRYFQDLALVLHGYDGVISEECNSVLTALADICKPDELDEVAGSDTADAAGDAGDAAVVAVADTNRCRLHSLSLRVNYAPTANVNNMSAEGHASALAVIVTLVSNAYRLHSFSLQSWPRYPTVETPDILKVLETNNKLERLEELRLFWLSAKEATWAATNTLLPQPDDVVRLVGRFPFLHTLCLRASMLSEQLLLELAKPSRPQPLRRLGILLTYKQQTPQIGVIPSPPPPSIPRIPARAWVALKTQVPEVYVDVTVVTKVPFHELSDFLKAEMPLVSLNFMRYARVDWVTLQSVADKFHATLRRFTAFANEQRPLDADLLQLVERCSKLDYLVYADSLLADTVRKLAACRATNWYYFQVNEDAIVTAKQGNDDNTIIQRGEDDGTFVIANHERYQSPEQRRHDIDLLISDVGKVTNRRWHPLTASSIDAIFVEEGNFFVVPPTRS